MIIFHKNRMWFFGSHFLGDLDLQVRFVWGLKHLIRILCVLNQDFDVHDSMRDPWPTWNHYHATVLASFRLPPTNVMFAILVVMYITSLCVRNILGMRMVLLMMVATCGGVHYFIEKPENSAMRFFPCLMHLKSIKQLLPVPLHI